MNTQTSADHIKQIPLRGIRGMIAEKMTSSLQQSAQLTHHTQFDASALNQRKQALSEAGTDVSVEDLLALGLISTLQLHPLINGTVVDNTVLIDSTINLCFAMALPGNLLVAPTVFNAQDLSLTELRHHRLDLKTRAADNKLSIKEMTAGTFTCSNLGLTRVQHFTPVLNAPQIAILGYGCTVNQVQLDNHGAPVNKAMMGLSLTFDHRAIDGLPAAQFLTELCKMYESVSFLQQEENS